LLAAFVRRPLMSRWHYKRAMNGGHTVQLTLGVTLRFELDG
jgi:hypothetical protein